ncbi:MAG TPA: MarR family transcriptional regulator [Polyangiaceae bacterium]|nr:MarR family transcriptional regulator [Polyangiaceae bacterium]
MRRGAPARRPAPAQSPEGAQEQIALRAWVRILTVHKRALAAIRDDLEHEMTLPRFDLLANLVRSDGQTLASLSRSMLVTAGNLTGLVDRAARDGMVERRADPEDRRAWRVHLTPKGQRVFREVERRHAARVARLFSPLSHADLEALVRLLDRIREPLRGSEVARMRGARLSQPSSKEARAARPTRRRARSKSGGDA